MILKYELTGSERIKRSRHSEAFLMEFQRIEPLQSIRKINSVVDLDLLFSIFGEMVMAQLS